MDTQQIELVGRAWLESELVSRGFEIARPIRDKGIDLVVFRDVVGHPFRATPIQLKAASREAFGIDRRYESRGIVMAYVWGIANAERSVFLVPYDKAVALLTDENRTTDSWIVRGKYSSSNPSSRLKVAIESYRNNFDCLCMTH